MTGLANRCCWARRGNPACRCRGWAGVEEMAAAGARFFAGGLQSAPHAKSLRKQPGGEVVITDGPYLETKEHIGGFWILDAANMDEAVAWGRKAVAACRASVEVREFLAMPSE